MSVWLFQNVRLSSRPRLPYPEEEEVHMLLQHSRKYRGQPSDQCPCTVDHRCIYKNTSIRMYFNHMGVLEDDFLPITNTLWVCHLLFPIHLELLTCERVSSASAVLGLLPKTSSTGSTRTPNHSSLLCPYYWSDAGRPALCCHHLPCPCRPKLAETCRRRTGTDCHKWDYCSPDSSHSNFLLLWISLQDHNCSRTTRLVHSTWVSEKNWKCPWWL